MFWLELLGYVLLLVAAISSSVSMNFQKLAQHATLYHDPRTRKRPRDTPLTTSVFCRPMFIIALFLSFAASTLDFIALTWLPPATVPSAESKPRAFARTHPPLPPAAVRIATPYSDALQGLTLVVPIQRGPLPTFPAS